MAATTISHNKPTAGSISWTAFNIAYNGANFTVPAGNTAGKFVWWVYNGGAPRLVTGDVLPELTADDTVLFLNKKGIGQLLPESTVVDGSLIVEESIYAQAIAADQINSTHIESDAITTKHLAAGSVTAEQLSVGTVSANLVANGSFEDYDADGNIIGWEATAMTGGTMSPVTGVASSGRVSIQLDATAVTANLRLAQRPDQYIPVSAASGRKWYVSARMGAGTAVTKGMYIRVNWYTADRVLISSVDVQSNRPLTTTFTVYEGQATPPATARYMGVEIIFTSPNVVSKMYLDEVTVHEVIVAANIGDGQITTAKLVAKSVTADKLVIRDTTNFLTDGSFEASGSGWTLGGNTVATLTADQIRDGAVGTKVLQSVANGTLKETTSDAIPAEAEEWYYASCFVRSTVASTSTANMGLTATVTIDGASNQNLTFQVVAANKITSAWTLLAGKIKLPAKTLSFTLKVQVPAAVANGTFQFDDVTLRRMNGGELIVDGAIKTEHMTANTISGDVIAANTLVGTKLMADSITARELVADEIWANSAWITAIQGKRIIGASIETNSGANAGLKMTSAGLVGYDSKGAESIRFNGSNNAITGEFAHTTTQPDGVVYETRLGTTSASRNLTKSVPGLEFGVRYNSTLQAPAGYSAAKIMNVGSNLVMTSGRPGGTANDPGVSQIELRNGSIYLATEKNGSIYAHGNIYSYESGDGGARRLPYGQLHVWKSSNQITLTNRTLVMEASVFVPSYAVLKISLHLRGYPSVANQLVQVSLSADNAAVGDHVHYSPIAWSSTDGTPFWTYSHSGPGKRMTFRITGTTVVPGVGTSQFIIPAVAAGGAAATEVLIEDIGSTVTAARQLYAADTSSTFGGFYG